MKKLSILFGLIFVLVAGSFPLRADDNCYTCHSDWEDEEGSPSAMWPADIHMEAGLGCADCHGGDATLDDMDEVRASKGYRGVPEVYQIPEFCGRCHGDANYMKRFNPALPVDQLEKYWTSQHGKLMKTGDDKVAQCVSCHSVHDIRQSKIPASSVYPINLPHTCAECHADVSYMKDYQIPTDQFEKFAKSVHGKALLENEDTGAPACNDCHGNHGAVPPGVDNIAAVCGICHAKNAMLFDESPHKVAYEENDIPQCEYCHGNHDVEPASDKMLGVSDGAVCLDCHSKDDDDQGYHTAQELSLLLDSLVTIYDEADSIIALADRKGMSVDDERFALKDVKSSLVESRTLVHSFSLEKAKPEMEKGIKLAATTHEKGLKIIDDYYFRRKGLGVASFIITLLAVLIWVKLRRIEK